MDSFGIIASLCTVAITALIIIYIIIVRKLRNKENFRIITKQAQKMGCRISEHEKESRFIIGIDHDNHYVFFYDLDNKTDININLAEIKTCLVNQATRIVGSGKNKMTAIDRVDLVFVNRDNKKADIVLECFDFNKSAQINFDISVLEKWAAKINNDLKNMKR